MKIYFKTMSESVDLSFDGFSVQEDPHTKGVVIVFEIDDAFNSSASWDGKEFRTAWSGFTYTLLKREDGVQTWKYEGALNGFLAQAIMPFCAQEDEICILDVEGSFGKFEGKDALGHFRAAREQIESKIRDLAVRLDLPARNGWEIGGAAAAIAGRQEEPNLSGGWDVRGDPKFLAGGELYKLFPTIPYAQRLLAAKHLLVATS